MRTSSTWIQVRLRFLVLVLAPLLAVGGVHADEPDEWARPYETYLPGTTPATVVACRVLGWEDAKLIPVAGAHISGWSEDVEPTALAARQLGEAVTDEYGFANVAQPDDGSSSLFFHWIVEAPGMAIWHDVGSVDEIVLEPGIDRRIRVVDPLGAPLRGARVGRFHGCPHSPALQIATTDARGEIELGDLPARRDSEMWSQLWIEAEGVRPGPYELPRLYADDGNAPPTVLTDHGRTATGVVLDEDERPLEGVVVRGIGYPRGPVTTTDGRGRFHLVGVCDRGLIGVFDPRAPLGGEKPNVVVDAFDPRIPLRVVLRPGRATAQAEGEPRYVVDVAVLRRWSPPLEPSPERDVPVRLVRLSDGFTITGRTGGPATGLLRAEVPAGRYRIVVGGGFSAVVEAARTVELPGTGEVRFVLDSQPTLLVRDRDADVGERARLRIPGESCLVGLSRGQGTTYLPVDVPAALDVDRGRPLLLEVEPINEELRQAGVEARPVVIPTLEPTRVRIRLLSIDPRQPLEGAEVQWYATSEDGEVGEDGCWTLTTYDAGPAQITAEAEGFQTESLHVELPRETGRTLDLGDVVLSPIVERTFSILHADGSPASGAGPERAPADDWGNEIPDAEGRFEAEVGPRPEPWVVTGEGYYPLPVLLSKTSGEEIRFPAGRVTIHVRDPAGRPLPAVAYVDVVRLAADDGILDLCGVPAGAHTIIVGARDHLGEVRRIVLRDGEERRIDVVLPPR